MTKVIKAETNEAKKRPSGKRPEAKQHNRRGKRRPSFAWPPPSVAPRCNACFKPEGVCFCPELVPLDSALEMILLQHPSEARNPESTARLASLSFKRMHHIVGLSWRSLSDILDNKKVNPQEWAVVYLGGMKDSREKMQDKGTTLVARSGEKLHKTKLKGLIFIDGNWRQAKTLWWRNPWLNRMNRLMLSPEKASGYSELRKQPRRECLSTIEAVGQAINWISPQSDASQRMTAILEKHLALVREYKRNLRQPTFPMTAVEDPSPSDANANHE